MTYPLILKHLLKFYEFLIQNYLMFMVSYNKPLVDRKWRYIMRRSLNPITCGEVFDPLHLHPERLLTL